MATENHRDLFLAYLLLYVRDSRSLLAFTPRSWGARRPRSGPSSLRNATPLPLPLPLKNVVPRPSPSTPLSWSGGATSHSAGAPAAPPPLRIFCSGESSRTAPSGSKVTGANNASSKNSKKRKTKPELLQEEVNSLLNERSQLQEKLAQVVCNLEKLQATNLNLKRRKMDIETQPTNEGGPMLPPRVTGVGSDAVLQRHLLVQKEVIVREGKFVVPDLNVIFEETSDEGPNEMDQI